MKAKLQLHAVSRLTMIMLLFLVGQRVSAQALTGVKTIPGSYSSVKMAIDSLNAFGVGTGGVTFNIAAGYTETLTSGLVVTATGTISDPIVFQKSGVGADPLITAHVGTLLASSTSSVDVMWTFQGSDYVTIDGIDLAESVGNTTQTTMMEVGYGFYKVSGTDGANNNTIQNCTITLNRNNITAASAGPRANATGSVGIEVVNATSSNVGTALTVTSVAGASSNNKFYGNTIQNVGFGILLSGFAAPSPYTLADLNNDIGGTSLLTGNNIINFGGGTGATAQCGAILINNQWSFNISYNTVNNNTGVGVNHPVTNRGIWLFGSSAGASCDINFNKITISGGASTSTIDWCLDFEMAQSGANGNTININNNQFLNCNKTAASTVAFTAIWINTAATTVNVNNNYFYGWSYSGTGTSQVILSQLAGIGTLNILNNTIDSTILTGAAATGTHHNIGVTAAPLTALNINENTITRTIVTTAGTGTKTLYGIYHTGSTPSINMMDNVVNDITRNGTTGGTTIGIYQAGGLNGTSTVTVKRNTVSNLSIDGTGTGSILYGIQVSNGTLIVDSNEIFNLTCVKTTGTGAMYGIYDISTPNNENFNYNTIYNLTHNGTGIVYGISLNTSAGVRTISYNNIYNFLGNGTMAGMLNTSSVPSVFNNKIYDLTTNNTAALILSGIAFSTSTAGNVRVYNNLISNLNAPFSNGGTVETVRGINITSTTALVTYGIYNNTINLNATSSGTNFSTAGVFHTYSATATSATLDLRNNIIVNTSTPNGTGRSSVIRRSAATDLNNFSTLSNRNLLFAGTPSATKLIFNDGTNFDSTLVDYVARVTPRDTNSVTENPTFLSTTGASAQFLKLDPSVATFTESAARNIAGITRDFANTPRAGNAGYTGLGGAPDMGAWEADNLGQPINQMVFDSASAAQRTGVLAVGSTNNPLLRVAVYGTNGYNALEATSFKINTSTTSSVLDIVNAKVYYTGSDSNFATTQLFGTTTSPSASFYVTGSRRLALGINYFWVTYDVSNSATPANFIDAAVDSIVLGGVNQSLLVSDPAGNRQIAARLNGNYNVGSGQTYTNLTSAFTELNLLGVSGPVTFTLKDATYDSLITSEVFPIVLSPYVGSSSINTVTIMPDLGVAATIAAAHSAAFELNGGDNFIFDGRQGGVGSFVPGSSLIISNANNPAIRLLNDATANTIKYCDLRSNNNIAAGTAGAGVVNFGTTTGANGNDSNSIKYCDIHDAGLNLLAVGISSIGSATTVAANNDANVVDSNNVYDYCNVLNATAAVYIGANNSTWQINGNRFYQTVPRTFTGTSHRVLWITPNTGNLTSASGFTINNNFIGGNAANGSGMYDLDGNNAAFVFAVMDISVGLGAATSIQNNTITNILDSTTSTAANAFVAINMVNGNLNCGTIAGNLIGSRVTNGAINFMAMSPTIGGLMGFRTGGGTGNTFNLSNNIVSGITLDGGTATTSPEFMGFNLFNATNVNATNNMVGDTSLPNSIHIIATSASSISAQRVAGFFVNPSGGVPVFNVSNNTIANITNNYAATGSHSASTKGINFTPAVTGTYTINNNLVKNISTASATTGSGINATLVGIGISQTVGTVSATGNIVHSLTLTSASTTAAVRNTGLFYTSATTGTNVLARNFTHSKSLVANNPFAVITGIELGTGNNIVVNNMVREGFDSTGAAITTACVIRGIIKNSGSNQVYFNTVFIGGSNVGADNSRTYAFLRNSSGTDIVNNNIFYNTRVNSSSGAGHFAVGLINNTTLTMNYNLLKADTIGLFSVTTYLTMPNWKAASGIDANSISSPLSFVNAAGDKNNVNLRLDTLVATPTEAYGVAVAVTGADVDFDGQTRSTLTPVDLGAHAGNFTPSDIAAPVITYTALINTLDTSNRTISVTITDATGVYTTGANRPRIYYKKMAVGTWFSDAGVLSAGSASNGTWQFTISSATLGGLLGDDSVYYYVVAQDSTAFNTLGSFPGGVEGTDVNSITVTPTPLSYKITPILSGTLLVGAGQTFTTLTGVNGMFNYLNTAALNGDITIQITSDIEETGLIGLNQLAETGVGGYKVRIVPSVDSLRSITGNITTVATPTSALIRINGADRVTIDGSYNGSGRYLRFMNRNLSTATIGLLNDADMDTIANCFVEGVNNTVALLNFQTTNAPAATGNDSNVVIGCMFRDTLGAAMTLPSGLNKPNCGIASNGTAIAPNDFNQVINCEFNNIRFNAINLNATGAGDYWYIYDNKVYQTNDSSFVASNLIYIQSGGGHIIRKNSLGGAAPDRSGPAYRFLSTGTIRLVYLISASPIPTIFDSNTIGNIFTAGVFQPHFSNTSSVTTINNNIVGGAFNPWDTIVSTNTVNGFYISGSADVNNNIIGNLTSTGFTANGIQTGAGTNLIMNIRNNTIRDIISLSPTVGYAAQGANGIYVAPSSSDICLIERNLVYNINAVSAKGILATSSSVGTTTVNANRVYNIISNSTSVAGAYAAGIVAFSSGTANFTNNQVSVGTGCNRRVFGFLSTATSNTHNVIGNSFFINGAGDSASYGIYIQPTSGSSTLNARNNIIYNKRTNTTGTAQHFAAGMNSFGVLNAASLNYNLMVVPDTAFLVNRNFSARGWSGWDTVFTNRGTYNTNWATTTNSIPADSLFIDTLVGNLGIVTANTHAWYVNGKGIATANRSGDYTNATGVRSTSIATGSTDIGSVEFTPSSLPPVAFADNTPTAATTTTYYFASRPVAKLQWDIVGSLPSSVDVRYYSGVNPSNVPVGRTYMNAYWDIQPVGGSGYESVVTLMEDSAVFGTVANASNLQVALYTGLATEWLNYTTTAVNNITGLFSTVLFTDSLGIFTGTDGTNNPLPVKLTTFAATAQQGNVIVDWSTASETNNRGFNIERSLDGRSFETVGFVKGAGNSNTRLSYVFNDQSAFAKTAATVLYYRLKQVDMNGKFAYSQIAKVSIDDKELNAVSAYPNPFNDAMQVNFRSANEGVATVRILNIQGMVVSEQSQSVTNGMNRVDLNGLSTLDRGMYFVQLTVNGETTVVKMMKN